MLVTAASYIMLVTAASYNKSIWAQILRLEFTMLTQGIRLWPCQLLLLLDAQMWANQP